MSEIYGIVKNATERGWPIEEIKKSLLNAGYSINEIDLELHSVSSSTPQQNQGMQVPIPNPQALKNYQTPQIQKKSNLKKILLISGIVISIIGIGALVTFLILKNGSL